MCDKIKILNTRIKEFVLNMMAKTNANKKLRRQDALKINNFLINRLDQKLIITITSTNR
jgi:hypothetical protein